MVQQFTIKRFADRHCPIPAAFGIREDHPIMSHPLHRQPFRFSPSAAGTQAHFADEGYMGIVCLAGFRQQLGYLVVRQKGQFMLYNFQPVNTG